MAVLPPKARRPLGNLEDVPLGTYGHSWVQGPYGGALGKRMFGRHNMSTYTTKGAGGTSAGAMSAQIQTVLGAGTGYPLGSTGGLAVLCSLLNDVLVFGSSSATVREAYRACFAQLWGIFVNYTTSQFSFGSGWTAGVTTTAGSYVDFSWVGDVGYFFCGFKTGASVNLTITNSGTGNTVAQTPDIGGYTYAFPGVIKLSGYGPGKHTVRVTMTSGAGMTVYGGFFENPMPPQALWVQEGAVTSYTTPQNTTLTTTYPAAVAPILSDFPNVTVLAPDSGWSPTQMLWTDGLHPNSKGITYITDRIEDAAYKLGYVAGMSPMGVLPTTSFSTAAIFPAVNYITGTLPATNYTLLKMHNTVANCVYVVSPEADFGSSINYVGSTLVITGGTGWTPGAYFVRTQYNGQSTPDGTKTLLEVYPVPPLYLPGGVSTTPPAALSTAGGQGYLRG